MGSLSPAVVLFDVNGNTLPVYNNTAVPSNTPALLFAGYDGYNLVSRYAMMGALGNLGVSLASNNVAIQTNGTITTSGSSTLTVQAFGVQEINLIVNITNAPTGTTPTLTFTIQEVDPGNGTTVFGNSSSTTAITGTGVFTANLNSTTSSAVKISWTITGTTPSFTGVYATITTKATPVTQAISGTITANNSSVGTDGATALTSDTQIGGKVSTSAPTLTNGNLNALSLNTSGGLRVDGVWATATSSATATTGMLEQGNVTTGFPTYTTGTVNSLSLTTSGQLRIDGVYAMNTAAPTTDVTYMGALVSSAPSSYTAGNLSPLTIDTQGNLKVSAITNKATTSNVTSVAGLTSNTAILASNTSRLGASIYNNTNKNMFVLCNSGVASTTNFTVVILPSSYWEIPQDYQGAINAVWATGVSGNCNVTEYSF